MHTPHYSPRAVESGSSYRERNMQAWHSPTVREAGARWTDAAAVTGMARKRELHGRERERLASAIGAWSGRKATPDERVTREARQPRAVAMPPPPENQGSIEAQADAEALLADLTSPSMLRRRGAKSSLRWMADGINEVRFDTYDESVATATEWDAISEAAVGVGLQQVLDRLKLTRYSAHLARMGIASLSDVGKRAPDALIKTAGLSPRECHALLAELLTGRGVPAARLDLQDAAWERPEIPMWEQPPRLESQNESQNDRTNTHGHKLAHQKQQWQEERKKLLERISEHEVQRNELRQIVQEQSRTHALARSQEAVRGDVLRAEIADLEDRLDRSEAVANERDRMVNTSESAVASHMARADKLARLTEKMKQRAALWEAERVKMQKTIEAQKRALEELNSRKVEEVEAIEIHRNELHVRGIGCDGWDGTDEGVGEFESEGALRRIFLPFGKLQQAAIRHRVADGKNTSWARCTMESEEVVEKILEAHAVSPIMAGEHPLTLSRVDPKVKLQSTGAMTRKMAESLLRTLSRDH